MLKPREHRWGGLPDSTGLWEWKPYPDGSGAAWVFYVGCAESDDDSTRYVYYPKPNREDESGFSFTWTGRTVGTIGGVFGRKVGE